VIERIKKPTLVISHNKTLAAQLYSEFKSFFPANAVEYFISYYDYYQPESYLPATNTYIEKDLKINSEIEKLRLRATSSLLSGRSDVIVVASVSCIYGLGNPVEFSKNVLVIKKGQNKSKKQLLEDLVSIMYMRAEQDFVSGTFRAKGDTVDIFLAYDDLTFRVYFFDDEIETIHRFDAESGRKISDEPILTIFPANLFVTSRDSLQDAMLRIEADLDKQSAFLESEGKFAEAERLRERTLNDLEMIDQMGFCSGIENYSRYFDGRDAGTRPYCLFDYFREDFLLVIDESHVTVPQFRAMYGGDRSRKINLVEYGFRLPSALDNRPLTFNEFEGLSKQTIYVSATPADYELQQCAGVVVEQIIRPTGLLDPLIIVKPSIHQIDDLLDEIDKTTTRGFRTLVTTLTKRMAEELHAYFERVGLKSQYMHSDTKTLQRIEIIRSLRLGNIDILIGVNMLREGLDLPEVALVAILDADKEGFLRNEKSLIQTIGRAARNSEGKVIMYADKITPSMERAISETNRRRKLQEEYNQIHGIVPQTVKKSIENILQQTSVADSNHKENYFFEKKASVADDPVIKKMNAKQLDKLIRETKKEMEKAAKDFDFLEAARLRDEMYDLQKLRDAKEA
jgi:excinuclease ABC subunit B